MRIPREDFELLKKLAVRMEEDSSCREAVETFLLGGNPPAVKDYTLAEMACSELRASFLNAMALMRRLKPNCVNNKRSIVVLTDKHLQRFCNELRNLAAEADLTRALTSGGQLKLPVLDNQKTTSNENRT